MSTLLEWWAGFAAWTNAQPLPVKLLFGAGILALAYLVFLMFLRWVNSREPPRE